MQKSFSASIAAPLLQIFYNQCLMKLLLKTEKER